MKANKNVFPYRLRDDSGLTTVYTGLAARDYIAIQAMVGILANSHVLPGGSEKDVAEMAYRQADAMIERSERNETVSEDKAH